MSGTPAAMSTFPPSTAFPPLRASDPDQLWQRFQALLWHDSELGIWLDPSRMALNGEDLLHLDPLFASAFAAMDALEAGAVANRDEERQVGHYWLRAPNRAPTPELQQLINREIDGLETFAHEVREGRRTAPTGTPFTDVLWIGIGGSGLGPLLMVKALQRMGQGIPFHFFDNVDPQGMSATLASLGPRLQTTLVVVVSKSGGTPEPRLGMQQARARVESVGGRWSQQAVAITMQGSQLDQLASSEGWLARFDMPDWVGGRTSITSAVGLLPAALIGADLRAFLDGAASMDRLTRDHALRRNPAALLAASWFVAGGGQGRRDMVVLPYRDRLEVFSRYLQQLVMESLGKKLDRNGNEVHQGLAVYGNKGSTDQHAYVQQLRDGLDNFFVVFIEALDEPVDVSAINGDHPADFLAGFLQGTRAALCEGERQSLTITLERFNERSLGALIALFERAVGFYGELINVNAYHQPGVEAGKKAAAEILTLQEKLENTLSSGQTYGLEVLQKALQIESPEPLFWILRHLCFNGRGYQASGDWGKPQSLRFQKT